MAALVLAARTARARVIPPGVGEVPGGGAFDVAFHVGAAVYGGRGVLERTRPARGESRRKHGGCAVAVGGLRRRTAPVPATGPAGPRSRYPRSRMPSRSRMRPWLRPSRHRRRSRPCCAGGCPCAEAPAPVAAPALASAPVTARAAGAAPAWGAAPAGPTAPAGVPRARRGEAGLSPGHRTGVGGLFGDRVLLDFHLKVEQGPGRLFLDAVHHGVEHVETLALVFHQRVALRHGAQADALAQVVHLVQVLAPLAVQDGQHDLALQHPHDVGRQFFLAARVGLMRVLGDDLGDEVRRQVRLAAGFFLHVGHGQGDREQLAECLPQLVQVPLLGEPLAGRAHRRRTR